MAGVISSSLAQIGHEIVKSHEATASTIAGLKMNVLLFIFLFLQTLVRP